MQQEVNKTLSEEIIPSPVDDIQQNGAPELKKRKKNNKPKVKPNVWREDSANYQEKSQHVNKPFEEYYASQHITKDEQELKTMIDSFRTPLPITFRVNRSIPTQSQEKLKQKIRNFAQDINKIRIDDSSVAEILNKEAPAEESEPLYASLKPVPFVSDDSIWQMGDKITKNLLRKHSGFTPFRNFLMRETEKGNISRQELVSMLPPLMFTNWKPTDKVLDMCAAPGSKTAQLVELLYQSCNGDEKKISGFVIANDNDVKRAYLLVHQLQRLNFLFPHLMISCHDATKYPQFTSEPKLKFDKVLCDIMCSGDGTIRKSPDIWRKWKANMGHGLHKLQVDCVLRAFDLLNVGGEIVYSTCALNPIEDEAVVAEIIRRTKGKLVLQDLSPRFPHLNYSPGMTTWIVTGKKGQVISSFEEAKLKNIDNRITESEFPKDDVKDMNMHYTMRIMPHQNNTGGFYIAHFKKVGDLDEPLYKESEDDKERIKQFKGRNLQKDSIQAVDTERLKTIMSYYGINRDSFTDDQFCLRMSENTNGLDGVRKIMYISPSVRKFVEQNEAENQTFNIINCGIRMFAKSKAYFLKCPYRITQEAASLLWNHTNDTRKIELNEKNFLEFLLDYQMTVEEVTNNGQPEVAQKIAGMEPGALLVKRKEEDETNSHDSIYAVGFKGTITLSRHVKFDQLASLLKSIGCEQAPKKKIQKDQKKGLPPTVAVGTEQAMIDEIGDIEDDE